MSQLFLSLLRAVKQYRNMTLFQEKWVWTVVLWQLTMTVGMRKQNSRMTTILQRIIVWGGGEDRQDREAEGVKKSVNDILINQCNSYKMIFLFKMLQSQFKRWL